MAPMPNRKTPPPPDPIFRVICHFHENDPEPFHVEYWLGDRLLTVYKFETQDDAQPLLRRLASIGL